MDSIFKDVRQALCLNQEALARKLNMSFAAINRWENEHAVPEHKAQEALFNLCRAESLDLISLIRSRIESEYDALPKEHFCGNFYHGSKTGIKGPVKPISRANCDFGRGFYMGTDPLQSLSLVSEFDSMHFYVVSLNLAKAKILTVQPGLDWAMLVAYSRGRMESIKGTALYDYYANMLDGKDVVIGSIADDKMFYVLKSFFNGNLTDKALVESLLSLKLGIQCVAITEESCNYVKIVKEIEISYLERLALSEYARENRKLGLAGADEICKKFRRHGRYFDEILSEAENV